MSARAEAAILRPRRGWLAEAAMLSEILRPRGGWCNGALPEISQTLEGMVQWCIQRYSDPEELVQ